MKLDQVKRFISLLETIEQLKNRIELVRVIDDKEKTDEINRNHLRVLINNVEVMVKEIMHNEV